MTAKLTIAIAADHGGFALKTAIIAAYQDKCDFLDLGTDSEKSCNYADYGHALAEAIEQGKAKCGIIICGSGIGISIAANRHKAVRAALCTDSTMARLSRLHNDANVLALGARIIGQQVAFDCVDAFFATTFEGGRHEERVEKLNVGV
ncbi:MAG: ribose 5-phosphate isomerase B [Micavibrio sp.]